MPAGAWTVSDLSFELLEASLLKLSDWPTFFKALQILIGRSLTPPAPHQSAQERIFLH